MLVEYVKQSAEAKEAHFVKPSRISARQFGKLEKRKTRTFTVELKLKKTTVGFPNRVGGLR